MVEKVMVLVAGCWLLVAGFRVSEIQSFRVSGACPRESGDFRVLK